jgi:transposase
VRSRIDWKYLLGLELTDCGFDFSVLSEFRHRLIAGQAEHLLLEQLLTHCRNLGLVKARGKQRTDSTRVLASIRALNRLELVAETLRAALNELATVVPDWLRQVALLDWYKRFAFAGLKIHDCLKRRLSAMRMAKRLEKISIISLECLEESNLPIQWRELSSIVALQLVWQRHYQVITDEVTGFKQVRWKPKRELARAAEGIESPYDIEARYRSRYGICWTGYMVHLSETCDSDGCHLITNVMTTTAAVHEAKCTQDIHQSLVNKQLAPDEHESGCGVCQCPVVTSSSGTRHHTGRPHSSST